MVVEGGEGRSLLERGDIGWILESRERGIIQTRMGRYMGESGDTRTAIMEATFDALVEHGYASLTIQTIADEFEKSKSLLYYHYDTKEALLVDFLRYLTDEFVTEVQTDAEASPTHRLEATLDLLVPPVFDENERSIRIALLELRMQAPYHEAFEERFTAIDGQLDATFEAIIADGVQDGAFDVDPKRWGQLLTSTVNGEMLRVVTGSTDPESARESLDQLVATMRT